LTPEFLETLRQAIRLYGHDGDMIETVKFGNWCYHVAGVERPSEELWEEDPNSLAIDGRW
jgi:hypothetical protein